MSRKRVRFEAVVSVARLLTLLTAGTLIRGWAQAPATDYATAREIKVLLLPPLDVTVDSARLQPLRQKIMRLREQYEFITRHFTVLGENFAIRAAAQDPRLDLLRFENRDGKLLDELAARAGADWVVSVAVREITADLAGDGDFAVHATVLLQIRDARKHAWLVNGPYRGQLKGSGSPGLLFIDSLDASVGEALVGPLAAFPQVVAVSRDGAIVDYLPGQTAPFTGEVNSKAFGGLGKAGEPKR